MQLSIETNLTYQFANPTDVLLQLEAAAIPEQAVVRAHIDVSGNAHFARVAAHDDVGERIWLRVQGQLDVHYTSVVAINRLLTDYRGLPTVPPHMLPGEAVQYLMPSRYCPSDLFHNFASTSFGHLQGGALVGAARDWVNEHFTYMPGTSTSATTALDSFVLRQGVCRDYAHVLITLVRACGIPARIASVYALGIEPQDFHAVAEVFLGGEWHLVDATGMAQEGAMAKIGIGRDAADVSFLTAYGQAWLFNQTVSVMESPPE